MSPRKPKAIKQAEPAPQIETILVFNTARFPVRYDAEFRTVPPQGTQKVQMNEYVQRAIDKGLFTVRS